jgi:hypothetical protein
LTRAALVLTGAALLATSPAHQYFSTFSKTVAGPAVELTAAAPSARFMITASALELGPDGQATTEQANATVSGVITQPAGATSFIQVRVTNADGSLPSELTVLSDFRLPRELAFSGRCAELDPNLPCQAKFMIELERSDGGSSGGIVAVNWSLALEARTPKKERDEGPLELPWQVEVSPQ